MKREIIATVFLVALVLAAAVMPAVGQDRGAFAEVGLHAVTNQDAGQFSNIGLGLTMGYRYKSFALTGEGMGSDGNAARTRFFATYARPVKGQDLTWGVGFFQYGGQDGMFGQVGYNRSRWAGLVRAGSNRFAEIDVGYRVAENKGFKFSPFYRYTHHNVSGVATNLHTLGLRFRFAE